MAGLFFIPLTRPAVQPNTSSITRSLFTDTPKLRELCEPIYKFRTVVIKTPVPHADAGPIESVTEWKDRARQEASSLVDREYGKPLDELLAYLRSQLPH